MARGDTLTSPWIWEAKDFQERKIQISIAFNNSTRAITSGSAVFRDADCLYTKIYVGLGADGTAEGSSRVFTVAAGTTSVSRNALNSNGLTTIDDVLALQITAGA